MNWNQLGALCIFPPNKRVEMIIFENNWDIWQSYVNLNLDASDIMSPYAIMSIIGHVLYNTLALFPTWYWLCSFIPRG